MLANRKRGVRVHEVVGLFIVFVIALAVAYTVNWSAIALALIAFHYYMVRWYSRPDFITKHGVAIWCGGIPNITPGLMDKAFDHFLDVMEKEQSNASREELERMLSKTDIEWDKGRVSLWVSGYGLKEKSGIQWGYKILVHWRVDVIGSALYHELLHEVNECVLLPKLPLKAQRAFRVNDVNHKDSAWWFLEKMLFGGF